MKTFEKQGVLEFWRLVLEERRRCVAACEVLYLGTWTRFACLFGHGREK